MSSAVVRLPHEIRAGDTLAFRAILPDYPASAGWSLSYVMVPVSGAVTSIPTTADGDEYVLAVGAAATAAYAPGRYRVTAAVSKDADRFTVAVFEVRVLADLAAATTGVDTRTHARKVLDLVEVWIESRPAGIATIKLDGREVQSIPIPDLLALRDRYRAEVRREEQLACGRPATRILTSL